MTAGLAQPGKPLVTVRASSVPELFDCAARWYAKHIDGLTRPSSGPAHLGTSLHASTAAFDQSRIDGRNITADDAAGVFVDTLRHPERDVEWGDDRVADAEAIGLRLHGIYCRDWAPREHYVGVEIQCDSLDVDCGPVVIRLTGHTDRVRLAGEGRHGIVDLKSGRRAVGADGRAVTKGHGLQTAVYELLAEEATGQPMAAPAQITGLQTTRQARVGVGTIHAARRALLGTPEQPGALHAAAQYFATGTFPGNPRSYLCSPKYCPAYANCHWRERAE